MAENGEQLILLIKDLYAFRNLAVLDLAKVAALAEITSLAAEQFVTTGEEQHSPFYMVVTGKVKLEIKGKEGNGEVLKRAEFFGADFLLYGKPRPTKAIALAATQLLVLQSDKLSWLLTEIPALKVGLKSVDDMTRWTHDRHFSWLGEEELVQLVVRKHPAVLMLAEIVPVLIGWVGAAFLVSAYYASIASFRLALIYLGIIILVAAFLYGLWQWIDWGNDYYVITDQRVVWLEEIVYLYDSRQESPLTAIKSNTITAPFWGRVFGFGNVIINAFMGQVVFQLVGDPSSVKVMIDKCVKIANERQQHSDRATMGNLIRRKIDPPAASVQTGALALSAAQLAASKGGRRVKSFGARLSNLFTTRWEEGDVITYRKHSYILFLKIGAPSLVELFLLILMILLFRGASTGALSAGVVVSTFLVILVSMIGVFLWWLYQYLDWHNDIFLIGSDKLVDSIKRPLGTEVTKSAPLANILSLDYIRRGFLGVLLNFGSVFINVGTETKLTFKDIADPARAQQDIFNRMYENQRKKQLADITKEGDQITDWLAAYHRQAEELRKETNKPQNE